MNFTFVYIKILKNEKGFNFIIYNLKKKILIVLRLHIWRNFTLHKNVTLKLLKNFFLENGFKILLTEQQLSSLMHNYIVNLLI